MASLSVLIANTEREETVKRPPDVGYVVAFSFMKNNHVNTCKTVFVDDVLSSLRDGSCFFQDLAHLLLNFRKKHGHTYAPCLYAYVLQHGLETHTSLGNNLVSMLVENGNMSSAHHIFDRLAHPNECSWNALIIGYVKFGKPEYSLTLFKRREEIVLRQPHVVIALLQACAKLNDLEKGIDLYNKIMGVEMLETSLFVGGALVDMYAKCGCLSNAHHVFDKLPYRDVFIWTALIKGYVEYTNSEETSIPPAAFSWKDVAELVMQLYLETTDGFYIEAKESSLVWHHQEVDLDFGSWQAKELLDDLESVLANQCVTVKSGQYTVEVMPQGVSKGVIAEKLLSSMVYRGVPPDFVLCCGDNRSDEDMFESIAIALRELPQFLMAEVFACTVGQPLRISARL
ncbi:hypothetical protein L7F22_062979 [Adiantum nelumboides]|nr:hypothetical protein [Adiantum nelumboides]